MDELEALTDLLALKDEDRAGWVLRGIADPETVAGHSWGTALLALLYADAAGVDRGEAVMMAVVHDVVEAETGDIAWRADEAAQDVSDAEKVELEDAAMAVVAGELDDAGIGADRVRELWDAYHHRKGAVARFVKDMDLVDMCLQALVYERQERYDPDADNPHFDTYDDLDEFFATSRDRLSTETGRRLFHEIEERYEAVRDG